MIEGEKGVADFTTLPTPLDDFSGGNLVVIYMPYPWAPLDIVQVTVQPGASVLDLREHHRSGWPSITLKLRS